MSKGSLEKAGFYVALAAAVFAGWSAYESHQARLESRQAIGAAGRSADAAEKSNVLVMRAQSSYLLPSIQRNGATATVILKNVSSNIALDVRAGYFLYTGPLKNVADVTGKFFNLPLRQLALALGGNAEATIIDSLVTIDTKTQKMQFSFPAFNGSSFRMATSTAIVTVPVPSHTLVIGLASFEDALNEHHTTTFCFPLNASSQDEECAKLNSLQLQTSAAKGS